MMARAHMITGATSWAVYQHYAVSLPEASFIQTAMLMAVCALAALLPDIDHPSSTLGQLIYPVSTLISTIFGHRGFTHSILALACVMYALIKLAPSPAHSIWITVISVGYLTHLVGDVITPAGLPLLYPIKKRFATPLTIIAGGFGESVVVVLYVLFATVLYTNWHVYLYQHLTDLLQQGLLQ